MNTGFKRLELRHFRLLQALAHADGMSAAAKHLHLTQSALSHQLKVLEETLGCPLFLRHGKKLVMTAAGRRALKTADEVLDQLTIMHDDLAHIQQGKNLTLRIASECITAFQWLPKVIPIFKALYPDIRVELLPNAINRVSDLLESGEIDLAIKMVPAKPPFENHILFADELVVAMAEHHELTQQSVITPEQLAKENILLCPSAKQKLMMGLSHHVDTQHIQTTEFPLTEAIVEWCSAGMGVSVLANWAVTAWQNQGVEVRPLHVPWSKRQWTAVTLPQQLPEYLQRFIELLKQHTPI